jgi:methyl-accepting chemotaxis protein
MKLLAKFNLILLAVFGAGGLIIAWFAYTFLINNARREVMDQAQLMIASAKAVRDYTADDISPLLQQNPRHKVKFLSETVPFYAATTTFNRLRKTYPAFTYKEASLNPTNPEDRATDWEADVIHNLRDHPEQHEMVGERETPTGQSLFLAEPITTDASCLECHSLPSTAPHALVATYGTANGFGWKLNKLVGAQIVSVPMSVAVQIAQKAFRNLIMVLVLTLLAAMLALDAAVYWFVIRPLRIVSQIGDRISKGEKDVPALVPSGKDEIASVTTSFNRMRVSLAKAVAMLEEQ